GDDPEAVVFVASLALEYRMRFRKDVIIDLVCYRRHGHSEADEPSVTQPMMYQTIRALPTTAHQYAERLTEDGVVTDKDLQVFVDRYRQYLDEGECVAPHLVVNMPAWDTGSQQWQAFHGDIPMSPVDTAIDLDKVRALTSRILRLPKGFELHKGVAKIYDDRRKMAAGALPIDWGFAENLAYATLLDEGFPVRLSGQDTARGAFFHRHASIYNMQSGKVYVPLRHLRDGQPEFMVTNSLLSEEAVLAFEYGYATTDPSTLVIWEAQFGDFANNAQVVFDQFISAGEQKWNRLCGLVVFLPHGYEGQGPEHSSARLERYLQLCAEHNIQICVPTTPAQMFHMLRRQMHIGCRKPLIAFTPKSLLRHKLSVSSLEDLTQGHYRNIIPEIDDIDRKAVTRIVLCSGKVFFDLLEKRRQDNREDVAIARVEQLYPFPSDDLQALLDSYPNAHQIVWCQEEPMNQGAWYSSQHHIRALLRADDQLTYAGRPSSAAPAVGYPMLHIRQLCQLLEDALGSTQNMRAAESKDSIPIEQARTAS
ncbi:MAG: 2-oxoglutarate dehydrogenase E1 component, partial [Gammaproteobacteria bacterium]|nr:2-oxoglutarate dehydrogenase E1 component [Gammaproteobacteria bacterium]